jgi:two-component system sensor histidine kinase DegS
VTEAAEADALPPDLAQRLLVYREADRRALATALHDEAAQTLANVALHLQICERAIAVDLERGRSELAGARAALSEAIARLRRQVFALRPTTLEETGLAGTLRRYVSLLPAAAGRSVDLADDLGGGRLDARVELGLYRIAQAALDATGPARQVAIRLDRDGARARLTFKADAPIDEGSAEGMTIRDWAAALDGELDLTRTPQGSQLTVSVAPAHLANQPTEVPGS